MSELIFITSGKGGTGKTTVSAALGCALSNLEKKVCLVDCDFALGNLATALGLAESILFDLGDVVRERIPLEKSWIRHELFPNLTLIPASTEPFLAEDSQRLIPMFRELQNHFDYIIVDGPAGIGGCTTVCASCAQRALIVTSPETPCLQDSYTAANLLRETGVPDISLVLNRINKRRLKRNFCQGIDDSMDHLGLKLMGIIREDSRATNAFTAEIPLMTLKTIAAKDIQDIALRLLEKNVSLKRYRGLF